ncbi:MAG: ribosome small subunit-dependent GTPase A [Methylotenera sp.]|uniref:ribosome small subunit-dependent GTPase A n=1 Tax=Methylotenera sp. TaxID=2051956 RepID=UPI002488E6FC|nr:ribosome small subunit-dependent GTPase A [Methylotenera sp.]MDI1309557.1 ribosome small subunit-dependent GTPase A [Methylotenera sp.]
MIKGTVVAAYGKRFQVELTDKKRISCVTRGKKTDLACGDVVIIKLTDKHEGVVESTLPRKTLLYRSNAFKSKMLAANVTQIIIVLATQPSFYEALLNRCLIAAEAANIKALIVLNKCDLADNDDAKQKLKLYTDLGYRVLSLSAKEDISILRPYLQNEASILVGQSGMGKSTIINALLPNEDVRTREVSHVLDSGKHTTTAAHLYHLDEYSQLIDSPGLQEFGLHHLSTDELEHAFLEFRPYLGKCRFNNCKHLQEPDCAITSAVDAHKIRPERLATYKMLRLEI